MLDAAGEVLAGSSGGGGDGGGEGGSSAEAEIGAGMISTGVRSSMVGIFEAEPPWGGTAVGSGSRAGTTGAGTLLPVWELNTSSSVSFSSLRMLSAASFFLSKVMFDPSSSELGGCGTASDSTGGTGAEVDGGVGAVWLTGFSGWAAGAGASTICEQCGQRTWRPSRSVRTPIRRPQNGHGNVCASVAIRVGAGLCGRETGKEHDPVFYRSRVRNATAGSPRGNPAVDAEQCH